jgi:pimeloyl-ACP methyl ester carboxylesterase
MVKCKNKVEPRTTAVHMTDGVALAVDYRGPKDAPTMLFAHGFGQTRGAWTATAEALARAGWRAVCFDARGHGESGRSPGGAYHIEQFIDDLRTLAAAQPDAPVLVGASMGGLLGLAAAGERRPSPFSALVMVDITPRWERAGIERILGFMHAHPDGFADLDDAARAVSGYLPHRSGKSGEALAPLLRRGDDSRLHWHWDRAMLEPIAAEGERYQARLEAAARTLEIPTLLLSGSRSDVVSRATIKEFLDGVPHARHVEVAGATHMLAGDANDAFTREIQRFMQTVFDDAEAGATGTR